MHWLELTDNSQLEFIVTSSFTEPVFIFKHSTRCSISTMAKNKFERESFKDISSKAYYLDLLAYRAISNQIADKFLVEHQSPQLLLIKNGKCIYHASHNAISLDKALKIL